ncbi:hypothetical protein VNI00_017681 [Paramarasmius palmivorus]|uniref:JmjC domain-containing protein n=1 Tax=Paramarasmius palmivorus TaxID=297713 RepID=A0AAW0B5W9_9AGAR
MASFHGDRDPSAAPFMKSMPWYTSFIADEKHRLSMLPDDLKNTAKLLLSHYQESCANPQFNAVFHNESSVRNRQKSAGPVMALLFGFRFLDVASMIHSEDDTVEGQHLRPDLVLVDHPTVSRSSFDKQSLKLSGISALYEKGGWPAMIRNVAEQLRRPQGVIAPLLSVDEAATTPGCRLLHAAFRQLHTLHDRRDTITLNKQLHNFEAAAFYMNWLLQGNKDFPDSSKDLYNCLTSNAKNAKLCLDFTQAFQSVDDLDVYQLRQPLFIALAISPLILLCDFTATSCKTGRLSLVKAWFHFGNIRPPVLKRVESFLWNELFHMARGVSTSSQSLAAFLTASLPLLDGAGSESAFFLPRAGIASSPPPALSDSDLPTGIGGTVEAQDTLPPEQSAPLLFPPDFDWAKLADDIHAYSQQMISYASGDPEPGEPVLAMVEPCVEVTEPSVVVTEPNTVVTDPEPVLAMVEPCVEVTEPSVVVTEPNTVVTDPDAAVIDPNTVTEPEAVVTGPEVVVTDPDAVMTDPITVTEPQAVVTDQDPVVTEPCVDKNEPCVEVTVENSRKRKKKTPPPPSQTDRKLRDRTVVSYTEDAINVDPCEAQTSSTSSEGVTKNDFTEHVPRPLVPVTTKKRILGQHYLFANQSGSIIVYQPAFYARETVVLFDTLVERAALYQRQCGMHPHVHRLTNFRYEALATEHIERSAKEAFRIGGVLEYTEAGFRLTADRGLLSSMLRYNHIVVHKAGTPVAIDAAFLSRLGSTTCQRAVHDLSIRGDTEGPSDHVVSASFLDVVAQFHAGRNGKVLNMLDIPGTDDRFVTPLVSSNLYSHRYTLGFTRFKSLPNHVPACDIYWHLLATADAHHPSHVDANGFATELYVESGAKLVFLGSPDNTDIDFMSQANAFEHFEFDMSSADSQNVKAVLLLSGDRLFMLPCTPHIVFTLEPSLCHGSHFYSATCIERSSWGIIHTFFRDFQITNQDHPVFHDLLVRMLVHWHDVITQTGPRFLERCQSDTEPIAVDHVPSIACMEGFIQWFSMFSLMEFGTILVADRYERKGSAFLTEMEETFAEMRVLCRECIERLDELVSVTRRRGSAVVSISTLARAFLVQQSVALVKTASIAKHSLKTPTRVESFLLADMERDPVVLAEILKIRAGKKVKYGQGLDLTLADCERFRWAFECVVEEHWVFDDRDSVEIPPPPKRRRVVSAVEVESSP